VRGSRRRRAAHVIRQQGQELDNVEWKEVKNRDGPDPRSTNLRLCRRAGRSAAASMNGYWANSLDRSPGCTGNSKTRWAVRRQVPTPSEDLGLLEGGTSRTHGTDCGKQPVTRAPRDLGMRRPTLWESSRARTSPDGRNCCRGSGFEKQAGAASDDGECRKRPLTTASVEPRLMHSGRGDRR